MAYSSLGSNKKKTTNAKDNAYFSASTGSNGSSTKGNSTKKNTTVKYNTTSIQNDPYFRSSTNTKSAKQDNRSILGQIYEINEYDPKRAQDLYGQYRYLQSDPSSQFYRQYSSPTNNAVNKLSELGFDTNNLTSDWINANSGWINSHLYYNGTTNTPSKPGKRASTEDWTAYWLYQWDKSEGQTKKAEDEIQKAIDTAKYWTNRSDLNMSDDEVVAKVRENFKTDYPTLYQMENGSAMSPMEMNRAVDFSDDTLYAAIWSARNPDFDGDIEGAMAYSALGRGNQYKYNPEVADRLNPKSQNFLPYLVMNNLDEEAMHFGVSTFTDEWIAEHDGLQYEDTTEGQYMRNILAAKANADEADEAIEALNDWMKSWTRDMTPEQAKKKFDDTLAKGKVYVKGKGTVDISILNRMDKTMGKEGEPGTGKLIPMSRGVNYKYSDFLAQYQQMCGNNIGNGVSYINDTAAAAGMDGTSPIPDQDEVTIKAQDAARAESAELTAPVNTPSEQLANETQNSVTYNSVQDFWKMMFDAPKTYLKNLANQMKANTISQHSYDSLNNIQVMYDYDKNTSDIAAWSLEKDALEKETAAYSYIGKSAEGEQTKTVNVDGQNYNVTISNLMDVEGKYDITGASLLEGGDVYGVDNETLDKIRNSEEVRKMIANADAESEKIRAANEAGVELTEEQQYKLNRVRELELMIEDATLANAENEKRYQEASVAFNIAQLRRDQQIFFLKGLGVDTTDIEQADYVVGRLAELGDYEATVWNVYNPSDVYRAALASGEEPEKVFAQAEEGNKEVVAELNEMKAMRDYINETGLRVPDNYLNNLNRKIAKLERDVQDYEDFSLMKNDDFEEYVAKGKEIDDGLLKNYAISEEGVLTYRYNLPGAINMALTAQMTDAEKDIYYYLIGKGDKERANAYYQSLADSSYGVLHTRFTDELKEATSGMITKTQSKDFNNEEDLQKWISENEGKNYQVTEGEDGYHVEWTESNGALGFIGSNILAILAAPFAAVTSLGYMGYSAATGKELNPNNAMLFLNNFRTTTREESALAISDYYGKGTVGQVLVQGFYEMLTNRLDSIANGVAFGGLTGGIESSILNELISASPMGVSAAMDAMMEAKGKGASDTQAWSIGLATFIAETGTEAVSLENIKEAFAIGKEVSTKTVKDFLVNWFKNAGLSEMVGESVNDIVENLADDLVMGELSEHNQLVWHYRMQNLSKEEAEARARLDELKSLAHTAIISYLSPGLDIGSFTLGRASYYHGKAKFSQKSGEENVSAWELYKRDKTKTKEEQKEDNHEPGAINLNAVDEFNIHNNGVANGEGAFNFGKKKTTTPVTTEQTTTEASPEEAGVAAPNDRYVVDIEALETSSQKDVSSQTSSIAVVLDEGGTPESNDMANAAAANLRNVFGQDKNPSAELQDLLTGANLSGNTTQVKQALQTAALSKNSEANRVMQSEEYQNANPEQRAEMLAATVEVDAQNATVQNETAKAIYENRLARAEQNAVDDPAVKQKEDKAYALQGTLLEKQEETQRANDEYETASRNLEEKQKNVQTIGTAYYGKHGNIRSTEDMLHRACNEAAAADTVKKQRKEALDKAKQTEQKAQEAVDRAIEDIANTKREIAKQTIEQENQQRAEAQAQAEVEAQVQAAQEEQQRVTQEAEDNASLAEADGLIAQTEEKYGPLTEEEKQKLRERVAAKRQALQGTQNAEQPVYNEDGTLTDYGKSLRNKILQPVAQKFGVNIEYRDTSTEKGLPFRKNGFYEPSTNTVVLDDKNASVEDAMYFVLGHELTHIAEKSGKYNRLANSLLKMFFGPNVSYKQTIKNLESGKVTNQLESSVLAKKDSYESKTGKKYSYEEMLQEIVADRMGLILRGDSPEQQMDNIARLCKEDPGTARRILDTIKSFLKKTVGMKGAWQTDMQNTVDMFERALKDAQKSKGGETRYALKINDFVDNMALDGENSSLNNYYNNVLPRDQEYFENILKKNPPIGVKIIDFPATVVTNGNGEVDIPSIVKFAQSRPNVEKVQFGNAMPRYYVYVPDIDLKVEIAKEGISHGFSAATARTEVENALVSQYIADILKNAVEVNRGDAHPDQNNEEHVLVGGIRLGTGNNATDYAVRVTIENKDGKQAQLQSIDVIGKLHAIKERLTRLNAFQGVMPEGRGESSATMNLADFFNDVKNDLNDTFAEAVYNNAGMQRANTRFSRNLRYSLSEDEAIVKDAEGEILASELPGGTIAVNNDTRYSLSSFDEPEQEKVRQALYNAKDEDGEPRFTRQEVDHFMDNAYGIAAIIAADRTRLDFEADPERSMAKPNADYGISIDASTLCAKRLLYQGTFDAIQRALPNTPLMPNDLIDLANMMRKMGYETPCGICYVESRRRNLGKFADEWLKTYDGEYVPTLQEVTTSDGLEKLRNEHRQAYDDYIEAMKKLNQRNPKVVQLRTDYRGEIKDMTDAAVQKAINHGGLRLQSFSDFETPHLLDMVQVVYDMASKGLTSQAYTKVPNFAWVFGDTGIKINLSLIAKGNGVDENGKLIFDDVEGMPYEEAMKLRNRYSKNVGTILVGKNDAHILAAMADDTIDFIIPFHRSGWTKKERNLMEPLQGYQDYTNDQNERKILKRKTNGKGYQTIPAAKSKIKNLEPVGAEGYWDFSKNGTENAEEYLRRCAADKRIPKFSRFLIDNGDGSFRLPTEAEAQNNERYAAVRKGYWKTLIDFKMYDNEGNPSEQTAVTPNINMVEAERVLADYDLSREQPGENTDPVKMKDNNSLPVAQPVVDRYLEEFKEKHPRNRYSLSSEDVDQWFDQYIEGLSAQELDELAQEMFGIPLNNTPKATDTKEPETTSAKEPEEFTGNIREAYMDAVNNGDTETARRIIDTLAKKAGYTVRGTHRSNAEFTVFDRSKQTGKNGKTLGDGFYVAAGEHTEYDNDTYGKNRMLVYIKPGKVFDIQENGLTKKQAKKVYTEYFAPYHPQANDANDDSNLYTTHVIEQLQKSFKVMDYIKEAAENAGVTTDVIFKELGYNSIKDGPQYVVFDPEQIKSADPMTYNDQGEMINPEERFSRNPDIRYSLPSDAPYLSAVDHGDMETAQEMVDEKAEQALPNSKVRNSDGRLLKVYHGTNAEFNEFRRDMIGSTGRFEGSGFNFTPYDGRASSYGKNVLAGYLNIENPLSAEEKTLSVAKLAQIIREADPTGDNIISDYARETRDYGRRSFVDRESVTAARSLWDASDNDVDIYSYISAADSDAEGLIAAFEALGYDGLIHYNDDGSIKTAVAFNSNQFKRADPVIRVDGTPIPLSERFNTEEPDIRYSLPSDDVLDQMIDQYLANGGVLGQQQTPQTVPLGQNEGYRQWGNEGAQRSDELDEQVKQLVLNNPYTKDTNAAELNRAVDWIRRNKLYSDDDGFNESLRQVMDKRFNYRTKDGQARMIAVMALAVAKNDVSAQADLAEAYNRQGTELGQALQARKLFRLMTPMGRVAALERMVGNVRRETGNDDIHLSDWIIQAASEASDEGTFNQLRKAAAAELAQQIPANWKDKLRSLRMLSMLGNPKTHVRNFIGNALFVPVVGLKNKMGAALEMATHQNERTKTMALVLNKDIREFARQDARFMRDTLTGEAKYNDGTLIQREQKAFNGFMQKIIDFNSKKLEDEDWFFLRGHYRKALGGWIQANGYTIEQLKSDPSLLEKGRAYAINEAQKATYRDFNGLADKLNKMTQRNQTTGQKALGFAVDAILPFRKTPANILKRGLEYSPVGLARSIKNAMFDMKNGTLSANQVIDRFCSGLAGTAVMALGYFLSQMGMVTCGMGDDDDKFEKEQGNQKYSIKLFGHDVTTTLDWAAPVCMPFFVGAAFQNELSKEGDFDVNEVINAISNIGEPVLNLSMLDGVNTLFQSAQNSDTDAITQIGAKVLSNYASSYVPSLLGAIARTVDDKRRATYVPSGQGKGVVGTFNYAREQIENKIPGLSQTNIPMRDVFGNVETKDLAMRAFENFIWPGYIKDYKNDPILNEMDRLYNANVTDSNKMIPKDPPKTIEYKKQKYALDAQQWDIYKTTRGQTAYQMLTELVNSEDYQNSNKDPEAQIQMIDKVWQYADKVGKASVIPDYDMEDADGSVSSITREGKVSSCKDKMMESLKNGDYEGYETMLQALHDLDVEDSEIKNKISSKYRDEYKKAYRKGDDEKMSQIEEILFYTGYDFDIGNWEEQVDKKYGDSGAAQRTVTTASTSKPSGNDDLFWQNMYSNTNGVLKGRGNIDLNSRQVIHNADGSISTEASFSFYDEDTGKEVLIPTVINGRFVSDEEAIDHYYETGEYLGMFDTPEQANEYAENLHKRQDWYYHR